MIDSLLYKGVKVGEKARLICHTQSEPVLESTSQVSFTNYIGELKSVTVERAGSVRALVKLEGVHKVRMVVSGCPLWYGFIFMVAVSK